MKRFTLPLLAWLIACGDQPTEPVVDTSSVDVPGASFALVELDEFAQEVAALVEAGALNHGQGNALLAKVRAAARLADQGRPDAALRALRAMALQVEGMVTSGLISTPAGELIVEMASSVVNGSVLVGSWAATSILVDDEEVLVGTSLSVSLVLNADGTFMDDISGDEIGLFCEGTTECSDTGTWEVTATTLSLCDPGCDEEAQYSLSGDEATIVVTDTDSQLTLTVYLARI